MEFANGVRPYVLEWFNNVFVDSYNKKDSPNSRTITRGSEEREVAEKRIGLTTDELVSKRLWVRPIQEKVYSTTLSTL